MTTEVRRMGDDDGLSYEIDLDAAPEVVWRLWTEADQLTRWMGSRATIEPWPTGIFRVEYATGDAVAGELSMRRYRSTSPSRGAGTRREP